MTRIEPSTTNNHTVYVPGEGYQQLDGTELRRKAQRFAQLHRPTRKIWRWRWRWPYRVADQQRCQLDGWPWQCEPARFAARVLQRPGRHVARDPWPHRLARALSNLAVCVLIAGIVGLTIYLHGGS